MSVVETGRRSQEKTTAPDGTEEVARILGPGGAVASRLPGYEDRPGQLDMARAVALAFSGDKVALLEAGTGTGKTFAYLVPAVLWAARKSEKTVVSTATIALQEQLASKDVPALAGALPPFRATVVKGRSNYVSLRRAEEAARGSVAFFDSESEQREVERLTEWARETKTGDRQELSPPPSYDAWERVESQTDNCLRNECPHYDRCHYFESRRAAARAQVLVVNHALLVTDLAAKRDRESFAVAAVLPPYERVIIDEAHHFEDVAAEHLSVSVSQRGTARLLGRLRHRRDAGRGLLPALAQALGNAARRAGAFGARIASALRKIDEGVLHARERALFALEVSFARAALAARARKTRAEETGDRSRSSSGGAKVRLRDDAPSREIVASLAEAREALTILHAELKGALEGLAVSLGETEDPALGTVLEVEAALGRLAGTSGAIETVCDLADATRVR
ncbi:DEAD/DEAH box helicase family protein, partial [bacterium]|nr:DEAD/DEAH box helicase family protein [bacterium]